MSAGCIILLCSYFWLLYFHCVLASGCFTLCSCFWLHYFNCVHAFGCLNCVFALGCFTVILLLAALLCSCFGSFILIGFLLLVALL